MTQLKAERQRLQEALKLLGHETSPLRPQRGRGSAASPSPKRKAAPRKARRGNTEGVVRFLRANPDAEAGAVIAHLGVGRGVIYNLLRRLVEQGTVEKSEGGNGRARYRLTSEARVQSDVSDEVSA